MIQVVSSNILEAKESIICQQVNCQGVMGSGLAKSIYTKWPNVKEEYHKYCDTFQQDQLLGMVNIVGVSNSKIIVNIFGQFNYGRCKNTIYTDYRALEKGFVIIKDELINIYNDTLAIPYKIGCGLANGDWDVVYKIINKVFDSRYKDKVKIYRLESR
jgi:O-acetyl-ADP-ribose deacetylase (regulator of RNase III)